MLLNSTTTSDPISTITARIITVVVTPRIGPVETTEYPDFDAALACYSRLADAAGDRFRRLEIRASDYSTPLLGIGRPPRCLACKGQRNERHTHAQEGY